MQFRQLTIALGLVATLVGLSTAANPPYPERIMKYQPRDPSWDTYLDKHWVDWKARFGNGGFIMGMTPGGQVSQISEAQSYGMLMSVWFNDESFFIKTWEQTVSKFKFGDHFSWKPNSDEGFAGDADQDIVGALIFASALQDSGYWKNTTYKWKDLAKTWMGNIGTYILNSDKTIKVYRGKDKELQNQSYHLYHWYPVFADFCKKNGMTNCPDWAAVQTACYNSLLANDPQNTGVVSNWQRADGSTGTGISSTQSMPNDPDMGFDAIRVPFRVGLDILWNHNAKAISYGNNVWKNGKIDPLKAGMYTYSDKKLRGWGDPTKDYSGAEYEKFMTRAMWGALAVPLSAEATANSQAKSAATAILENAYNQTWAQKLKAWSYFADCCTDTTAANGLNNARKIYFAQSLAIMGSLVMNGRAWNVYDDLMNKWTVADTSTQIVTALSATPNTFVSGSSPSIVFSAKFSKSVNWTLTITGAVSKKTKTLTGTGSTIAETWNGTGTPALTAWSNETINATLSGGAWATGDKAKTTLTVTTSNAVKSRTRVSALSWTSEGLLLPEDALSAGVRYTVRELDLKGSAVASYGAATAQQVAGGIRLAIPRANTGAGLRVLAVDGTDGSAKAIVLPLTR